MIYCLSMNMYAVKCLAYVLRQCPAYRLSHANYGTALK